MLVADIWDVTKQEEVHPTVAVLGKCSDSDNDAADIKMHLIKTNWIESNYVTNLEAQVSKCSESDQISHLMLIVNLNIKPQTHCTMVKSGNRGNLKCL